MEDAPAPPPSGADRNILSRNQGNRSTYCVSEDAVTESERLIARWFASECFDERHEIAVEVLRRWS